VTGLPPEARSPAGELVDVVDDDDAVVEVVTRATMRAQRLRHRAVFVAVVDRSGRLLVHRRSATKDLWPGWWDLAVGGVVASGEAYDEAARRELAEEVGVVAEPTAIGGGRYTDDDVALIGRCYLVRYDGPLRFDDGEVVEARWVSAAELGALRTTERFLPDSLALLLPLLGDAVR
jgi:8-oxo-dGTP pyrophosphatase MutT (NUDIX family)